MRQSCFRQPPTIGRLIEATRWRADLRPQFWGRKTTPINEAAGAAPNVLGSQNFVLGGENAVFGGQNAVLGGQDAVLGGQDVMLGNV